MDSPETTVVPRPLPGSWALPRWLISLDRKPWRATAVENPQNVPAMKHCTGPNPVGTLWATATFYSASDRKSTRLNSSHVSISYAVFCLKKKKNTEEITHQAQNTTISIQTN